MSCGQPMFVLDGTLENETLRRRAKASQHVGQRRAGRPSPKDNDAFPLYFGILYFRKLFKL